VWGAFTIGLAPFTTVAVTGELTFVLLLPATLLWRAWRRGEWRAAGAWLGVCASLKLFFLLFVPLLVLRRRWASLSALAASVAAIVAIGSLVFGLDTYRLWLQSFERVGWWWMAMNASWHGLVSRFFGMTTEDTLRSWTVMMVILGFTGLICCLLFSLFV